MTFYSIFFIPYSKDYKKIEKVRKRLCNKFKSNIALKYPIHLTLTPSAEIKNYKLFEKEIKELSTNKLLCTIKPKKYIKSMKKPYLKITTNSKNSKEWAGLLFKHNLKLIRLQKILESLVKKYAVKSRYRKFKPHISLVYDIDLKNLKTIQSPIKELYLGRITIMTKSKIGDPPKAHKHILLK